MQQQLRFRAPAKPTIQHRRLIRPRYVPAAIASPQAVGEILTQLKVDGSKVTVAQSVDGRSMLTAAKDLGAGEAVISVPDGSWISQQTVAQSPIGKAVAGLEPWLQLALYLVHQRFASQPSSAYVKSLGVPSSPLFWSQEQIAMLQGTQVYTNLEGYRYTHTYICLHACIVWV